MIDIHIEHLDTNIETPGYVIANKQLLINVDFGQQLENAVNQGVDIVMSKNPFLDEYDLARELRETLKEIDLFEFDKSDMKIWLGISWK